MARAAGVTTHQIELNGAKIRCNSGEEVWIYRHSQSDDTRSASILHGANANDGKVRRFILLQQPSEELPIGSNFYQQPWIAGKFNFQARKLTVVYEVRLCSENALRIRFADASRQSTVGRSDVLRDVGKHVLAALNVFIEKVRSELRIENARRAHG